MANSASGIAGLGTLQEIKQRLLFLLGAIVVFRLGATIPVPGVDPIALAKLFDQHKGTILDYFNMFSGGALGRLTVFALGVMPYISASIIVQLLTIVSPTMEQWRKEGESGRRRITKYTRYGTVVLATFQSVAISIGIERQTVDGLAVVPMPGMGFVFTAAVTLVTGTMFLMWLGEQITERGVGNGISMLIFAGIVAGLPAALASTLQLASSGELSVIAVLVVAALAIFVTAAVIFVEKAQRRITVNYAKRQQGRGSFSAPSTHLPLKLNMSGVIPPIFASSIILFPATLASWFGNIEGFGWLASISHTLSPGEPLYVGMYAAAIIFFCFFYTALVFNAKDTAENLKKSGAFIPGVRPGEHTARYIDGVMTRITLWGALYITAVCLLPEFLILSWHVPFYFGGTSLLIIVVVVMDFMAQLQSHLMSHQYGSLLKKAKLK